MVNTMETIPQKCPFLTFPSIRNFKTQNYLEKINRQNYRQTQVELSEFWILCGFLPFFHKRAYFAKFHFLPFYNFCNF